MWRQEFLRSLAPKPNYSTVHLFSASSPVGRIGYFISADKVLGQAVCFKSKQQQVDTTKSLKVFIIRFVKKKRLGGLNVVSNSIYHLQKDAHYYNRLLRGWTKSFEFSVRSVKKV